MKRATGKLPVGGRPTFRGFMIDYIVKAKIDQIVTRNLELVVSANSEEEASVKVREALSEYPKPVTVEGISRILVLKSDYWIPRDIDLRVRKKEANG